MHTSYFKEYKIYLKRAKFLIESDSANHPTALLCLLIYYGGYLKYLSSVRKWGKLSLKLNKRYLTNWLFSFKLDLYDKFMHFVIDKFYKNIKAYRGLLLKNVDEADIHHHLIMLDLLFDPEELVLSLDVFKYLTLDVKFLVDLSINHDSFILPVSN